MAKKQVPLTIEATPAARRRARRIYDRLLEMYPNATCALNHQDAWQLLVATILSAQCTDERVNLVTPKLFERYPRPADMAEAKPSDLESLIRSTGFYRNKAKNLQGAARAIVQDHGGDVPSTMDQLLELPGVARKTANVVLGNAFDTNAGMVVDTHVGRLAVRLELTRADSKNAVQIERDLMALFPRDTWMMLAHLLISHGRAICNARKPACSRCPLSRTCPKIGVANPA